MQVTDIPFNKHLDITQSTEGTELSLLYRPEMTNHLQSVHAGAQFALAEACSGQFLLQTFPGREEEHLALLRKSEAKFRDQTQKSIRAVATAPEGELAAFIDRLEKRGRALVTVTVTVSDETGKETMVGRFDWFVQRLGPNGEANA